MSENESPNYEIEREAAEAVTAFLEARERNPDVSPEEFAPQEPQAAREYWRAIGGWACLIGDIKPLSSGRAAAESKSPSHSPEGRDLAGYRIIRELGRGGMGVVFEAEQGKLRRTVALKIVRGGFYVDEHRIKLFQREIQALARLKHPFIAAIYEAGRTDEGEHFFAMELVQGSPVMEYVSINGCDVRERLALFRKICEAINYAHQRGVIHRDLKPSNIMIDGEGNPKILDFGLARITETDVAATTAVTEVGHILGTLSYMSPEQAHGNPDEIDLRSDVYSLGVLLYELLTGRLPYDVQKKKLHEALGVISDEPPVKPSKLEPSLRGELEFISLRTLEKEPHRRYQSAAALAEDLERYLNGRPVEAHPPSRNYQFRKLVARNKAAFAFVSSLFVVIIGFSVWMSVLYAESNAQRQLAEQREQEALEARAETQARANELEVVTEFQQSMLGEIDAARMGLALFADLRARVRDSLVKEGVSEADAESAVNVFNQTLLRANATDTALNLLDEQVLSRAVDAIERDFADQPLVRAALLQTVADTYREIGRFAPAMPLQEAALDTYRAVLGDDHRDTLVSIGNMGALLFALGDYDRALVYYREALDGRSRVLGSDHPETLGSACNMAMLLSSLGMYEEALDYARMALDGQRRVLGDEHRDTLISIDVVGDLLHSLGRYDDAIGYLREALDTRRRVLGDDHPETLVAIGNLGMLYKSMGEYKQAAPYFYEALEGHRRALGNDHPRTLIAISNLGWFLQAMGKYDEAESFSREALERKRRVLGDDHPSTLTSINNMGLLLKSMGKLDEALVYYREALERWRRVLGDNHPDTLTSINNMGGVLFRMGRYEEALVYYREALKGNRRTLGDNHPQTLISIHSVSGILQVLGRVEEAVVLAEEAVDGARRLLPSGHRNTGLMLGNYGKCLFKLNRFVEAESALLEAYEILKAAFGANHWQANSIIDSIIDNYDAWHAADPAAGHDAQAAEWRAKLEAGQSDRRSTTTQPAAEQTAAP